MIMSHDDYPTPLVPKGKKCFIETLVSNNIPVDWQFSRSLAWLLSMRYFDTSYVCWSYEEYSSSHGTTLKYRWRSHAGRHEPFCIKSFDVHSRTFFLRGPMPCRKWLCRLWRYFRPDGYWQDTWRSGTGRLYLPGERYLGNWTLFVMHVATVLNFTLFYYYYYFTRFVSMRSHNGWDKVESFGGDRQPTPHLPRPSSSYWRIQDSVWLGLPWLRSVEPYDFIATAL